MWMMIGGVATVLLGGLAWLILRRRASRGGPVSLVLLRSSARKLSEADVRGAVRRALGVEAKIDRLEFKGLASGFVAGCERLPPFVVISSSAPYSDRASAERMAGCCEDAELRGAIRGSMAWVSVDAPGLARSVSAEDRLRIYDELLGKVAAELIDSDCLALYAPAERRFARVDKETERLLREGRIEELLGDDDFNAPIFNCERDDRRINAAIKEAQARFDELLSAFRLRGEKSRAMVKVRFETGPDAAEHLWTLVKSTGDGRATGEVVNQPHATGLPGKGELVTFTRDRVSDWAYIDEAGNPQGLFVERLLGR